jgi:hypothetical protein
MSCSSPPIPFSELLHSLRFRIWKMAESGKWPHNPTNPIGDTFPIWVEEMKRTDSALEPDSRIAAAHNPHQHSHNMTISPLPISSPSPPSPDLDPASPLDPDSLPQAQPYSPSPSPSLGCDYPMEGGDEIDFTLGAPVSPVPTLEDLAAGTGAISAPSPHREHSPPPPTHSVGSVSATGRGRAGKSSVRKPKMTWGDRAKATILLLCETPTAKVLARAATTVATMEQAVAALQSKANIKRAKIEEVQLQCDDLEAQSAAAAIAMESLIDAIAATRADISDSA